MSELSSPSDGPAQGCPRAPRDYAALSLHKVALIAGLVLATLLPNWLISGLIAERETRQGGVKQEMARNWGPPQYLYTPVLVVPYEIAPERPRVLVKIAATRVDLAARLATHERRRGLFEATVYDAAIDLQGAFVVPSEAWLREPLTDKSGRFIWEEGFIALGSTTRLTGVRLEDKMTVNGAETALLPGREAMGQEIACQHAATVVAAARLEAPGTVDQKITFKAAVSLRGTGSFTVLNNAKELHATMRSPWGSPSFTGDTLPVNASLTAGGFEARWEAIEFGAPGIASGAAIYAPGLWKYASVGVDLIEATPVYRMINRVAKYGLLFVVLSFATYLSFELLSRLQIHIVQYGLLGLSLSLFSLLLLALAEPIGYTAAYGLSAALVLMQSSLYTWSVARRVGPALAFAGMLSCLFAFLHVVLGLETYSLLIGALALFAVVSALMVLTQKVSWPGRVVAEGAA
jgi:inner membrane protein